MHFFTQSFSPFLKTCWYHLNLILSVPSLSLNSLHVNLSVTLKPHIHLSISLISSQPADRNVILPHPFNNLFSRTTWVSWHQKGKPFWFLLEQEMMGWQWHQLDHTQIICTSPQTDNHARTSPLSFYTLDGPPAAQPTASEHWRERHTKS